MNPQLLSEIAVKVGGKWKLIILHTVIFQGVRRFNELHEQIQGITRTMLTNQLRELEADGLVRRKAYAEMPPKVEYSATERATKLRGVFVAMEQCWLHD